MIRKFALTIAMGMFAAMATNAQAGILESIAPFDGVADTLKDNSRAQVFTFDGSDWVRKSTGDLVLGDIIVGLIRIDQRTGPLPGDTLDADEQLFGLFSVQITGGIPTSGGLVVTHSAVDPTAGTGLSLKELIDPSLYAGVELIGTSTGITGSDAFWASAAIAVIEKDGVANPLDSTDDGLDIIDSIVGAGSSWTIDAIGGFGSSSDFLHTRLNDPGITDISDPNFAVDERAGFTVFADSLSAEFIDVSSVRFSGTGANTLHDLVIVPVTSVTTSPESNWDLADSATFRVNILPEPGSMTLLGLGLLGLAGAGYRRRKAEKIEA